MGALGSTGGAQDQVPWPGEENRLVAIAARAGSHTRETDRDDKGT